MRFLVLTYDKLQGCRQRQIVEAESSQDAQEQVSDAHIQVIRVSSLSIEDRIAARDNERAEAKMRGSTLSMRRINRRLEYRLTRQALHLDKGDILRIEN